MLLLLVVTISTSVSCIGGKQAVMLNNESIGYLDSMSSNEMMDSIFDYKYGTHDGKYEDERELIKAITRIAENGNIEAQAALGDYYGYGLWGLPYDTEFALKWWTKSASKGQAIAQYELGNLFFKGFIDDFPPHSESYILDSDLDKAIYWYNKSAKQGYLPAKRRLGEFYYYEIGVEKDYYKAYKLFKESGAYDYLYKCYKNGHGVSKDEIMASLLEEYRGYVDLDKIANVDSIAEKARNGDAEYQYKLGSIYYQEEKVDSAIYWWEKAAISKNKDAQYLMGQCYKLGVGVEQNMDSCITWWQMAADQGDKMSELELLDMDVKDDAIFVAIPSLDESDLEWGEEVFVGYANLFNDTTITDKKDYYNAAIEKLRINDTEPFFEMLEVFGVDAKRWQLQRENLYMSGQNVITFMEKEFDAVNKQSKVDQKRIYTAKGYLYFLGQDVIDSTWESSLVARLDSALKIAEYVVDSMRNDNGESYPPALFLSGMCCNIKADRIKYENKNILENDSIKYDCIRDSVNKEIHNYKHKAYGYFLRYVTADETEELLKGFAIRRLYMSFACNYYTKYLIPDLQYILEDRDLSERIKEEIAIDPNLITYYFSDLYYKKYGDTWLNKELKKIRYRLIIGKKGKKSEDGENK